MYRRPESGWLEVICGPMFSGKSEELIRRVTRSRIARLPVQTFKPSIDVRYADAHVVSHSSLRTEAAPVADSEALLKAVDDATVVVGIDEGQFFPDFADTMTRWFLTTGRSYYFAALDLDFMREII